MNGSSKKTGSPAITFVFCGLLSLAALLVGCAPSNDAPLSEEHDLPVHYPKDLADGAKRIEQLLEQISAGESTSRWQPSGTTHSKDLPQDAFEEVRDLVGWLPNLAADSDLGEGDWALTVEIAMQLSGPIEEVVSRPAADRKATIQPKIAKLRETIGKLKPVVVTLQELQSRYMTYEGTNETPINDSETK